MGLAKRLQVPAPEGGSRLLDSDDLRATPPELRTWNKSFYNLFWLAAVTNVSNWSSGSSFLSLGVTFWEGVGCATAGFAIGFPVVCRSSFGIFGAAWPAVNRAFMACVWQGVNAVTGAQALYTCLHAIFPSFARVPKNTMGSNSALTSAEMLCFFLFSAVNVAMLYLKPHKWHRLIYAKLVVYFISTAGMLALAITQAGGGVGPVVSAKSTIHGSERAWLLVRMILTSAASCSTFASNASDWQRNATRPNDPIIGQLIGFPFANFFTNVIGMLVASCSQVVYGEVIWMPTAFLNMILDDNYDAKHRAGCFFIAAGFVFSLLFSATVENAYPCGNDLAALLPRYISIRRGFFLCIAISCVINPWFLMGSASKFITVLSSYQIFLFSIAGIIIVDYFVVSKGFFIYEDLYHRRPNGAYHYTAGFNPRAFVAYALGVGCNFAGFLNNLGVINNDGLQKSYYFAIFTSTFVAGASYWLLTVLFPQPNMRDTWSEPKGLWVPPECQPGARGRSEDAISEEKDKEDALGGDIVAAPRYELAV
ncbi:hypothetical protein JCM10450v2_007754 [Rhodotorula kratochvilovae]